MKHIMIIEDDMLLQLVYKKLLEAYDAKVYVCSNISEATECISNNPIDLIISDYNLPDANSMVFLKLLKAWKSKIPTIVITANNDIRNEQPGLDSIINALLFKPIKTGEFHHNVNLHLSSCA